MNDKGMTGAGRGGEIAPLNQAKGVWGSAVRFVYFRERGREWRGPAVRIFKFSLE